jgi:XTP/dITP diphosphohydrolase
VSPIVLATRNAAKVRELAAILRAAAVEVTGLAEMGMAAELPEEETLEHYPSFAGNALAKATFFAARTGCAALADDSGIVVDALAGAPGVLSRRFAADGSLAGDALDAANNALLLERLLGMCGSARAARYVCVAALATPSGGALLAVGTLAGTIAETPRGNHGFGYDPLFLLLGGERTVAETPTAEKNRWSHRARAFRALAPQIPAFLKSGGR